MQREQSRADEKQNEMRGVTEEEGFSLKEEEKRRREQERNDGRGQVGGWVEKATLMMFVLDRFRRSHRRPGSRN